MINIVHVSHSEASKIAKNVLVMSSHIVVGKFTGCQLQFPTTMSQI